MHKLVRIFVSLLALLFVVGSLFRTMRWFIHDIYWVQEYLGGDKTTHFLGAMLIMYASQLWFNSPLRLKRLLVNILLVITGLFIEEQSQQLLSSRNFSYEDFQAGVSGVVFVSVFSFWYLWLQPQIPKSQLK